MKFTTKLSIILLVVFNLISLYQHRTIFNLDIQGIHTWRQCQTMWNIRNFIRHDNNILNPRISSFNGGRENLLRYEFPLMQWSIAQPQRVFGENILAVRVSMFMIGLIGVWAFAFLVKILFKNWLVGVLAAILLQYSPLFYYYTMNPLPDVLAFSMSIIYVAFIVRHRSSSKTLDLLIASTSLLIATLCKLPFLMLSVISIYCFINDVIKSKKILLPLKSYAIVLGAFMLPAFAWYVWVMPTWAGNPILTGQLEAFNLNEYLDIVTYHAQIMFPTILTSAPVWLFCLIGIWAYIKSVKNFVWALSIIAITFLYLFLELKPIDIVHDYYLFPFLIWIYLFVAFGIHLIIKTKIGLVLAIATCIISSLFTAHSCKDNWSIEKSYFNKDLFLFQKELEKAVPNSEPCIILNDMSGHIFSYKVDKMGHIFSSDYLPISWIDDMVRNRGVQYMYSDSRTIDESVEFQKYIHHMVMQKGSIKVLALKLP